MSYFEINLLIRDSLFRVDKKIIEIRNYTTLIIKIKTKKWNFMEINFIGLEKDSWQLM